MLKKPGLLLILLFTFCLTSCGFHLRGQTVFAPPLQKIYIKTQNPYGELAHNLKKYFKLSGVYVADSASDATTVLNILSDQTGQQLLGINGTQQTSQYNLTLGVTYQLTTPEGIALTTPETLTESRTLAINSNEILGGSNEAAALYTQMRRSIVFDLMNRLSSQEITSIVTKNTKPT